MSQTENNSSLDMKVAFVLAEVLKQCSEAMKDMNAMTTIDFKKRPVIRATNKASQDKNVQQLVVDSIPKLFPRWTIDFDKENEILNVLL